MRVQVTQCLQPTLSSTHVLARRQARALMLTGSPSVKEAMQAPGASPSMLHGDGRSFMHPGWPQKGLTTLNESLVSTSVEFLTSAPAPGSRELARPRFNEGMPFLKRHLRMTSDAVSARRDSTYLP